MGGISIQTGCAPAAGKPTSHLIALLRQEDEHACDHPGDHRREREKTDYHNNEKSHRISVTGWHYGCRR